VQHRNSSASAASYSPYFQNLVYNHLNLLFSQPTSIEKHHDEEFEQQTPSLEPTVVSRKQVTISPNVTKVKENTSEDTRSNRKSMFEPAMTRRASPSTAVTNPNAVERVSSIILIDLNFYFIYL
jgi:hypothetical protein